MHLRVTILSFLLLSSQFYGFSQNDKKDTDLGKAAYIELVGKGFFSANFDFSLGQNNRMTIGLTALDHEFAKTDPANENFPTKTLPTPSLMLFKLYGKEKHYFEAGIGLSISPVFWKEYSKNDSFLSLHGNLGYRYQASNQIFFRAGLTPFYRVRWAFLPLAGISIGYSW